MSHFSVLVIGDVESQMAPYQENNMGTCPPEYMEFTDLTEEYEKEYAEGGTERLVAPDGSTHLPWDEKFANPEYNWSTSPKEVKRYLIPEGYVEKEFSFKETYATLEIFLKEWNGVKGKDPKNDRYGYWENPNAKWDYYRAGGRWGGKLLVKPGVMALAPKRDVWDGPKVILAQSTDQAKAGDIDWEAMRTQRIADARANWAHYLVEKESKGPFAAYMYGVDKDMTEEAYIERANHFSTFAVVKDGKWYEKGDMGWWGIVTDAKDEGEWLKQLSTLLEGLSPDTQITVVDCHI